MSDSNLLDERFFGLTVGKILETKLSECNISYADAIERTKINRAVFYGIMKDERRITPQTATRLESIIDWPAFRWLIHQAWYDVIEERYIVSQEIKGISRTSAKQMFYNNRKQIIKSACNEAINNATMGNHLCFKRDY